MFSCQLQQNGRKERAVAKSNVCTAAWFSKKSHIHVQPYLSACHINSVCLCNLFIHVGIGQRKTTSEMCLFYCLVFFFGVWNAHPCCDDPWAPYWKTVQHRKRTVNTAFSTPGGPSCYTLKKHDNGGNVCRPQEFQVFNAACWGPYTE